MLEVQKTVREDHGTNSAIGTHGDHGTRWRCGIYGNGEAIPVKNKLLQIRTYRVCPGFPGIGALVARTTPLRETPACRRQILTAQNFGSALYQILKRTWIGG